MLEDEAKTKWCPFARVIQFDIDDMPTGNRLYTAATGEMNFDGPALCIGSACMAWRWNLIVKPHHQMQVIIEPDEYSDSSGYCGLAKHP